MVPTVQFRSADDVVEKTQAHGAVGVLKEAIDRIEHEVRGEHLSRDAHQDKWQRIERELNSFLKRMESSNVEPVKPVRRMMHGVVNAT